MKRAVSSLVPPWKKNPLRADLVALYNEVDALLSPYTCDATAECCRFGITNREPYPTAIELAEVYRSWWTGGDRGRAHAPSLPRLAGEAGYRATLVTDDAVSEAALAMMENAGLDVRIAPVAKEIASAA